MPRRAISPIVAIGLLVLLTFSAATFAFFFYKNTASQVDNNQAYETQKRFKSGIRIESVYEDQLSIRNTGETNLTNFDVYVDETDAEVLNLLTLAPGESGTLQLKKIVRTGQAVRVTSDFGAEAKYTKEKSTILAKFSIKPDESGNALVEVSYSSTFPVVDCWLSLLNSSGDVIGQPYDCITETASRVEGAFSHTFSGVFAGTYSAKLDLTNSDDETFGSESGSEYIDTCSTMTCGTCTTEGGCLGAGCFWTDDECSQIFKSTPAAPNINGLGFQPNRTFEGVPVMIWANVTDGNLTDGYPLDSVVVTLTNATSGREYNLSLSQDGLTDFFNYSYPSLEHGSWTADRVFANDTNGAYAVYISGAISEVYSWLYLDFDERRLIRLTSSSTLTAINDTVRINVTDLDPGTDCSRDIRVSTINPEDPYSDVETPFWEDAVPAPPGECNIVGLFNVSSGYDYLLGYVYHKPKVVPSVPTYSTDLSADVQVLCLENTYLKVCLWNETQGASISNVSLKKSVPGYSEPKLLGLNLLKWPEADGVGGIQPFVKYNETAYGTPRCICKNYTLDNAALMADEPFMKTIGYNFSIDCTDVLRGCPAEKVYKYSYVLRLFPYQNYYDLWVSALTPIDVYPQDNPILEPHIPLTYWNETLTNWTLSEQRAGEYECTDSYCGYQSKVIAVDYDTGVGVVLILRNPNYKTDTLRSSNELVLDDGTYASPKNTQPGTISLTRTFVNDRFGATRQAKAEVTKFVCAGGYDEATPEFFTNCYDKNGYYANATANQLHEGTP